MLSVAEKLPTAVAEAIANSGTCGCEVFGAAGRRQCIQNCLTASYHLAPFETLARDRTRNPLHASTQSSSLPPQPLLAAAFEPGRTFSTTSARRQQQQTRQNQRPERYLRQHAFETLAHDLKPKRFTQARKTLSGRLSHCCRQLLSRPERSAHRVHAHSSRETAPQRVG